MALQKTPVPINFAQGLDTKSDPKQVQAGKFQRLVNSVFDVTGQLTKRNGFDNITDLPDSSQTTVTTLNDNLIATGSSLLAYSADTDQWLNQGTVQPVSLSTLPLVRVSTSQSKVDTAVAENGLVITTYVDNSIAYYQISDSITGQQIVGRTALPSTATSPKVFVLGRYFVITFLATVSAATHLQYITIPLILPNTPSAAGSISTAVTSLSAAYDGHTANGYLYLAWSASATTIRYTYITDTLIVSFSRIKTTSVPSDLMSITVDVDTEDVWISYYDATNDDLWSMRTNNVMAEELAPVKVVNNQADVVQMTSSAQEGVLTVFYEVDQDYSFSGGARTDLISSNTVQTDGSIGTPAVMLRSVGIASKSFVNEGTIYLLLAYGETNQPTYFLSDSSGNIIMRLAYGNGGGYVSGVVLPSISVVDGVYHVAYLFKDFLTTVNKTTDSGMPANAIYSQLGVNLAKFSINMTGQYSSEIANSLHLTGGQLWQYDGVKPVEHGFHVYPENVDGTTASTGGSITPQLYNYVFTYEWTDNQGNLHRSAPSIPFELEVPAGTNTNQNTIYVPTLRLTYKVSPNPVRIVGYRWSVAQQTYYQFTSVTSPTVNDTTVDYVTITDSLADSSILGNTLLYTTGGVIENIAAPASVATALFKNRLFLIDAENPNTLWFSKQVIQSTPVEMSDLLTLFIAPTSGAQGSTGAMKALSAMDDKLIIFKKDAIYYLTGIGPDNTGAQNDFTDPIFITASVGCDNPNSIVLMPTGIMFKSDKGIWLLGRDLSTSYIGADVEEFNDFEVQSAEVIPGTNQVRFILEDGLTLVYDYYQGQWGTFSNVNAISACLYQSKHTYLNQYGKVFQEAPGTYLDGSQPVLMSYTTSWINVAGLKGYERFYFMYLLGTYYSPFKLETRLAYDYDPNATQSIEITPDNFAEPYGGEAVWGGGGPWGGPGNIFQARIFPQRQKCISFQITINEVYDSSMGQDPGQGLSLSGMNLVIGVKKGYSTQKASRSFG